MIDLVEAWNRLIRDPWLNRQTITTTLTTTGSVVPHALRVQPTGWVIIAQNANATVWNSEPPNSKQLTLSASAPVIVTLEVY